MKWSLLIITILLNFMQMKAQSYDIEIIETSASGNQMTVVTEFQKLDEKTLLRVNPEIQFQTLTGIGGSFTESSAYLLNQLSPKNREKILQAYFSQEGANYSLTRTHISSCDFSLKNYTYAPVAEDMDLKHFSIEEDQNDLIPMIKEAQKISEEGFKIIASPWTAPPWMKDNNHWVGGKLLPKYYDTWSLFFSKYLKAYQQEGIDIWAITVENEPHGNGNNWESMHYSPEEMTDFVQHHLGPKLEKDGWGKVHILGYDQNRAGIKEWVDVMYATPESSKYYAGTAIHWYESTYDVFEGALQYAHFKAPNKYLIETEGCIDAEVPHWKDDAWYWKKEATDWGWDWAGEHDKYLHPKYSPVYRYAKDMIGCFNNWVDGWIDWNMVLDRQGGPNWFKNWCTAPVIVDPKKDEVYFTPLYYTMAHFSKYIRPGAKRIDFELSHSLLEATAFENPDGTITVVILNMSHEPQGVSLNMKELHHEFSISAEAIQTILLKPNHKK